MRLWVLLLLACAKPSVRDLVPQNDDDRVAFDTEMVCSRSDAAGFTQIPVQTARWQDLAARADARTADAGEALKTIAELMKENRSRFSDSRCTDKTITEIEKSAKRMEDVVVGETQCEERLRCNAPTCHCTVGYHCSSTCDDCPAECVANK